MPMAMIHTNKVVVQIKLIPTEVVKGRRLWMCFESRSNRIYCWVGDEWSMADPRI